MTTHTYYTQGYTMCMEEAKGLSLVTSDEFEKLSENTPVDHCQGCVDAFYSPLPILSDQELDFSRFDPDDFFSHFC